MNTLFKKKRESNNKISLQVVEKKPGDAELKVEGLGFQIKFPALPLANCGQSFYFLLSFSFLIYKMRKINSAAFVMKKKANVFKKLVNSLHTT